MIHTPRVGALISHLNFSPRAIYESRVSERSEASNVSERSEASNVSERSEASSVTGDFLWGYFLFSATSFFLPGGSRFFYPSHFFLLGDSECSP